MAVDEALREKLRAHLSEYLAQPGLQHELKDVAAFGALPLYWDVGGCLAIRPDGTVVSVYWDKPDQSFREAAPRWRTAALVAGAARYPELAALLPARPAGAADCANCVGEGLLPDSAFCGVCSGLGWGPPPA